MAKQPLTIFTVTAVVAGLALPALAAGQAIPRTGSVGTSSSSGSSSGGSSSSSGSTASSGSASTGSSGSSGSVDTSSRGTHGGGGSDIPVYLGGKGGGRGPAPARPEPGGTAVRANVAPVAPVNAAAERRTGAATTNDPTQFSSSLSRPRGDNPITGFAAPRAFPSGGGSGDGDFVSFPFWGPWGSWYPWYSAGFGWGFNYYGYNPWSYGATCWGWGRWGAWYDPFGYCWNPYWGAPTAYVEIAGAGGSGYKSAKVEPATGKIRILASPKTASVYVDDALVGIVDEFDGLGDQLELDKGRHVISVRADGYEPVVQDVVVEGGRTKTVRLSMKKVK